MLTEKSIQQTTTFTSYSQFHSALHCAFQVVSMGDFRSNMKTSFTDRQHETCDIQTVSVKPTASMPLGVYKVIADGLFWGHYEIVRTWTGEKAVIPLYLGCYV